MALPRRSPIFPTLVNALLNNPTITGTVSGGAVYSGITLADAVLSATNRIVTSGGFLVSFNPTANDSVALLLATQTLANKTLSSPSITGTVSGGATYSSISLSGTVGGAALINSGYLTVDASGGNTGIVLNSGGTFPAGGQGITFGGGSGEGISSQRQGYAGAQSGGTNQFGLDFWTNFTRRMYITNAGTINTYGTLQINAGLNLNQQNLYVYNTGDTNHLLWYNSGINGSELRGYAGVRLLEMATNSYIEVLNAIWGFGSVSLIGGGSLTPSGGGVRVTSGGTMIRTVNGGNAFSTYWNAPIHFIIDATDVKTFVIDHPLKKDRYLRYVALEGPHNDVWCRGEGRLEDGETVVSLPDHFVAITDESTAMVEIFEIAEDDCDNGCHLEEGDLRALHAYAALPPDKRVGEPPHHRHARPTHLPPNLSPTRVKDGQFTVRMTDGHVHPCTAFWWRVTAQRSDIPVPDLEPLKKDYALAGDGPYTYLKRRTA